MGTIEHVKTMLLQMQQNICTYTPQQTAAALGYAHTALVAMECDARMLNEVRCHRIRELESQLKTARATVSTTPADQRPAGAVPK